jgi:hypothetical protein
MNMKRALFVLSATVALAGTCVADDGREEKPRFEGVELYSWNDKEGDWLFVLLDGTNREKTENEVKMAENPVKGVDNLKKAIGHLAVGEHVSWSHRIKGFEFPAEATRKDLQEAAKDAEVDLQVRESAE